MRIVISRVVLFVTGFALLLAALFSALDGSVVAAPRMLITETPATEPPTRTYTPTANGGTSTPTRAAAASPTSTAAATATATKVHSGGGGGGRDDNTPTATPVATDVTSVPQVADPAITKSASVSAAQIGDSVEFTITATNLGNAPANNVVVEDTLPAFLALDGASATRGDVSVSGNTVRVTIGSLAPGEVVTITVTTRVVEVAVPPNNSNGATVASDSASDDPSNNSSSVSLTIDQPTPTAAPPVVLPNTSDPHGGASLPVLLALGLGLIAASLLTRRRGA